MKKFVFLTLYLIHSSLISFSQKANIEEIEMLLERHNFYRSEVGVPDISYSDKLAEIAFKWSLDLKNQDCAFKHSQNIFGENMFQGTEGYFTIGDAVDSWGAEKSFYNYKKNACENEKICGHYTQLVWKNTTDVGCAKLICNGNVIWICNYSPPGNYVGQQPY